MDNSIRLKKLEVVNGALCKRDERLILIFFKRVFFSVRRGGWGNSTPFQGRFCLRDWDT
jgi:hypothetical protein